MALKGNVEALSLLEVFEILQASGHSGILRVGGPRATKVCRFYKGSLYYQAQPREATYRLGKLLVRNTRLTEADLEAGIKIHAERGGLLGQVLVTQGYVSEEDLRRVLALQYKEEVYDLFLWKPASFEFEKDVLPEGFQDDVQAGRALPLPVSGIVMEAANRIDEWRRIHRAIPSLKLICEEMPGRSAEIDALLAKSKIDPHGTRFDGRASLETIFAAWEHTFFDSHRLVFQLLEARHIAPVLPAHLLGRAQACLARGERAQALRYYEAGIECVPSVDTGLRMSQLVLGPQGWGAAPPEEELGLSLKATGKKALYVFLAIVKNGVVGRLSIAEGESRRVLISETERLVLEVYGPILTPGIASYARRRGLITDEQAAEIEKKRQESERSTVEILLGDGYVRPDAWNVLLTDKLVDEVYDVFFWREPRVELRNRPGATPEEAAASAAAGDAASLQLEIPFSIAGLLDGLMDQLKRVRGYLKAVPSIRTVFLDSRPGGESRGAHDVLRHFDGRKSVNDVLPLAGGSRQAFLQFLSESLAAGKIRHLEAEEYREGVERALKEGRFAEAQVLCLSAIDDEVDPDRFRAKLEEARYAEEESLPSVLEGDFESISFAEILQSLHRRRVSGTLDISDGKRKKTIYFLEGDVYLLRKEEAASDFAADFLDEGALEAAHATFGGDHVAQGLVNEEQMSEALALEVKQEIWEMFLWEGANFVFSRNTLPGEFLDPPADTAKLHLATDAFLLEAIRRITEWEELKAKIPTPAIVLQFTSPELKMQAIAAKGNPELLYLIDGRRSLGEVVRVCGMSRTEVYRVVAELEDEGALRRVEAEVKA